MRVWLYSAEVVLLAVSVLSNDCTAANVKQIRVCVTYNKTCPPSKQILVSVCVVCVCVCVCVCVRVCARVCVTNSCVLWCCSWSGSNCLPGSKYFEQATRRFQHDDQGIVYLRTFPISVMVCLLQGHVSVLVM